MFFLKPIIELLKALNDLITEFRTPNSNCRYIVSHLKTSFIKSYEYIKPKRQELDGDKLVMGIFWSAFEVSVFSLFFIMSLLQTIIFLIVFSSTGTIQSLFFSFIGLMIVCILLGLSIGFELRVIKAGRETIKRYWGDTTSVEKSKIIATYTFTMMLTTVLSTHSLYA